MINIISGQTAVTSTPNNAPQKKDKASLTAQNNAAINTSAESTVSNDNSMQEDTAIRQVGITQIMLIIKKKHYQNW